LTLTLSLSSLYYSYEDASGQIFIKGYNL